MATQQEQRQYPRAAIETEVQIKLPDVEQLVSEYSANLSIGGMFINRQQPLPVGTQLRFLLSAGEDDAVISGKAVVVWVRDHDLSPAQRAGMGVRFTVLDNNSLSMIFDLVDRFIQDAGGEPFQL